MFSASRSISVLAIALTACSTHSQGSFSGPDEGKRVIAERGVVSSANPLASDAGLAMLRMGGNAVDAAVATAFAIGVVEPQMSGVGGGGAALVWLQSERRAEYLDFYAAQPAAPFRDLAPPEAQAEGDLRIVAIPGSVRGLLALHERFGALARADVMAPAIALAEDGFPLNQILAEMITSDSAKLLRFEDSRRMMWPGGTPLAAGTRFRNPALAEVLRGIAREGERGFYEGAVAQALIA
jgi:gamma-glutamyltranspeptidase/glutathione hydrolase